ncbi:ATP-binding protein [Actinoplanes sp. NPDC026623]|uniref:two-component system sensor histidine kinase NtrB n=1 Tax=Actinoplanes sp. NPDC026623 TaxID=3155610 RepID=UPI0033FF0CAD
MDTATVLAQRWLPGIDTMLGQVRTLFVGVLLAWPVFGLWGLSDTSGDAAVAGAVAAVLFPVWIFIGYRRQRFPAWSWIVEGACVCLIAEACDFGATIGLIFAWVCFRSLYGEVREKYLAATVLCALAVVAIVVYSAEPRDAVPLLFTALLLVGANHVLARGCIARDRVAYRRRTMASVGSGLVAATTRAEAMEVTMRAALQMDRAVTAALIFKIAGPALRVAAVTDEAGVDTLGWVTEYDRLPEVIRAELRPEGYAIIEGPAAAETTEVLRLPRRDVVAVAPLTANGHAFGMLVLTFDRPPAGDLSDAMVTLADSAALTLDQLLSRTRLGIVVEYSPDTLILAAEAGSIRFVNPAAATLLGCQSGDLLGRNLWSLVNEEDLTKLIDSGSAEAPPTAVPCRLRASADAGWAEVEALVKRVTEHDGSRSIVFTARDVSDRHQLELELRHAQKLESVGRLAAGIAHEINTPIQFVGDNVRFMESAFADLDRLLTAYRELVAAGPDPAGFEAARQKVDEVASEIDMDFLMEDIPTAISQTLEGVVRVANIVRAMKAFGHPGTEEKSPSDLNEAIRNTLVVAANEIKYVADVEADYGDLPLVYCHLGDINQVVLNLVVNAAHAIGSADRGRGTIRVRTRLDDDGYVTIEVADTGTGVPPEIADRLFEPFFTTKEVGSGTGQGLPLVRSLVTDRHGGTIDFTSTEGQGTVFTVRLPVGGAGDPQHGDMAEAAV